MISTTCNDYASVYVRVLPGEHLHEVLSRTIAEGGVSGGAVVSATGSASALRYGVVQLDQSGTPYYTDPIEIRGAIELTGVQGSIGIEADGKSAAHLHGTFALSDGRVVAGHIYDLTALVTMELTLLVTSKTTWVREFEQYPDGHKMPVFVPAYTDCPVARTRTQVMHSKAATASPANV